MCKRRSTPCDVADSSAYPPSFPWVQSQASLPKISYFVSRFSFVKTHVCWTSFWRNKRWPHARISRIQYGVSSCVLQCFPQASFSWKIRAHAVCCVIVDGVRAGQLCLPLKNHSDHMSWVFYSRRHISPGLSLFALVGCAPLRTFRATIDRASCQM